MKHKFSITIECDMKRERIMDLIVHALQEALPRTTGKVTYSIVEKVESEWGIRDREDKTDA